MWYEGEKYDAALEFEPVRKNGFIFFLFFLQHFQGLVCI